MTIYTPHSKSEQQSRAGSVEPLLTIQQAARELGVHIWALRRAVKSGAIPAYAPFNGRKFVRLSEVVAAINASKIGGDNV